MARRGSRQGGMSVSSGQLFSSSGNISVNDWMDGIPVVPDATITSGLGAGAAASGSSGQSMCVYSIDEKCECVCVSFSPLLTPLISFNRFFFW